MSRNVLGKEIKHITARMELDEREIFVRLIEGFTNIKRPQDMTVHDMTLGEIEEMLYAMNPDLGTRLCRAAQSVMDYLEECVINKETVN